MERSTRQRSAIHTVLEAAGRPLTPQEILEAAREGVPGLGMATVYRQLKSLQEEAVVAVVDLPGESPRYEVAGLHHHHHFQCDACGRVFDIHACPGELGRLAPPGFTVARHELTLYGRCEECGARSAGKSKAAARKPAPRARVRTHAH